MVLLLNISRYAKEDDQKTIYFNLFYEKNMICCFNI